MAVTPEGGAGPESPALSVEQDGIAVLSFDAVDRSVNVLATDVMRRLDDALRDLEREPAAGRVRALVIRSGKEASFIAGADVREIAAINDPAEGRAKAAEGQRVFSRLAALPMPTVAAVNGICLGGGTELILACSRRIAADTDAVRIGLPETRLGIIPGFGGTTRLPRLIGTRAAAELIASGKPVSSRRAQAIGLVDERVPAQMLDARAIELARELASRPRTAWVADRGARIALENAPPTRKLILWLARKQVMKETAGRYPAPLVALETIDATLGASRLEDALALEADAVGRLITTDVSKNLIHVFFLMEGAKKKAPAAEPLDVDRVAVLGAGTMGGGIAQLLAYRGLFARLKDIEPDALALGLRHARKMFDRLRARRKLDALGVTRAMERISPTLNYSGFGSVDLVIEAVVERMDVKQSVLRETEAAVAADAVLATNTSSLSVSEMQRALDRPDRFCGMHFFNPVHRMPLVEVVRGELSSDVTIATVFALARRLEKTPLVVADGPGFLVNRLLAPYLNEAGWLLSDGASIEAVDEALTSFGMPMGPLRLLDEVGLDVARHAGETMFDAFGDRLRPAPPLVALDRSDRRGRKNGRGFYRYEKGDAAGPDDAIYAELQPTVPTARTEIAADEIRDRTLLAMVNEAARVLEERIVPEAGDVDLGMITGTGFPPFCGGLLRWADARGLAPILERVEELERRFGKRFEPAPLLRRLASAGARFYDRPDPTS